MKNIWKDHKKDAPIVALAPMDGYCDSAFRCINKIIAPDIYVFSEFYSSDGIKHNPRLPEKVLPHYPEETPVIFQIFGNDPETFVIAGKIIQSYGAAGIDINMGCPAKKVVKCWYGSGLMIDRDRAYSIVGALAENLDIPISVKTRLGWDGTDDLIDFGVWLEQAGCSLLSVHGRTFKQAFSGDADWTSIFDLKRAVSIPVLGNGDVANYDDGVKKMHESYWKSGDESGSIDGFMIGRAAIGNPWCFLPWGKKPKLDTILEVMQDHADRIIERKWEQRWCLEIRKHVVSYLSGFDGARSWRSQLAQVESKKQFDTYISQMRDEILTLS